LTKKLESRQQKFMNLWLKQFSEGKPPNVLGFLDYFSFEHREEQVTVRKKLEFQQKITQKMYVIIH
jgi:aminoglycoside phosphotransferase family enzyme